MKKKRFTVGLTFFTTPEMYKLIRSVSDKEEISQSQLLRLAVEQYLKNLLANQEEKTKWPN